MKISRRTHGWRVFSIVFTSHCHVVTRTLILIADFCSISSIKKQLWKANTVISRHIEVFSAHWWQHNKYLSESDIHWLFLVHLSFSLSLPRFKWPFFWPPQDEKGQTRSQQQLAEGYWGLGKPVAGAQHTHTRYFLTAGLETGSCQHGNEGKSVILEMSRIKVISWFSGPPFLAVHYGITTLAQTCMHIYKYYMCLKMYPYRHRANFKTHNQLLVRDKEWKKIHTYD